MTEAIVVGIGGNIGTDAELIERFRRARDEIGKIGGQVQSAPLYRTAAIGPSQAPFLNTAVKFQSGESLSAELMASLLEIERELGRTRSATERFGPRAIDLDVLIWGARVIHRPELEVPHPRLGERRFALVPLAALVGEDFEVPGLGRLAPLLDRARGQVLEQVAEHW